MKLRVLLLALFALAFAAAPAWADAPDPIPSATHGTLVTNSDGSRTLTVWGGTDPSTDPGWQWTTHGSDCNTDRSGAGYAIDWNDPTQQYNPITGKGNLGTFFMGTQADNVVHPTPQLDPSKPAAQDVSDPSQYANWRGGCGVYANHGATTLPDGSTKSGPWSQGTWGPISHTYPASVTGQISVCPIMYDVHGKSSGTAPNGAKEITAGGNGHNGDNSLESNGNTPQGNGCFTTTFTSPNPAIAIDKTGPATANAGDKVTYTLTVTDPGNTSFPEGNVNVSDPQCNGAPVTLVSKNGDGSPGTLDPGDSWTYNCSVQTSSSDTAVHNVATVVGTDTNGNKVQASDTADTTLNPPQQAVLGTRVTPGAARLLGPTGCVAKVFTARVRGTKIAKVTFVLDGKVVKRLTKPTSAGTFGLRINPAKMRVGVHRLVTKVTFKKGSGTAAKTLRLSFQRCAKRLAKPRFTG
jgi:uncharacterized repeat protein (TIGR01451 family)